MIEKTILSIDWDPRTLRIVHGTAGKRSVKIDQVLSVPIPADVQRDDPESLGSFIHSALNKAKIRTRRAVVDMPREQVNLYTLNLPKASQSDLASMVAFQIPKELPYPVDQATVDFTMRREEEQEETNPVLVAVVQTESLDFYSSVFEHAGLKLQRVGLRPNANEFAVNALLRTTPHERVLFVDVGPVTTEIDVLHNGRLVFSRAASVNIPKPFDTASGVHSGTEPVAGGGGGGGDGGDKPSGLSLAPGRSEGSLETVVGELMIEVTRSIEAYRATEQGGDLNHAVIGGSCDIEEALSDVIQKQYRISAQPYNPATCFGWDADRGAAAGAFAATLGLVLAQAEPSQSKFDFLHPKRAVTLAERQIKRAPVAAAAAVLFIAAGFVFYLNYVKPQYQTRDELRSQIREVKRTLAEHEDFEDMVSALQDYESQQIVWVDKLYDVVWALPDNQEIVLKSLDMRQKDHIIKFPYRASNSNVGSGLMITYEAFRVDEQDRQPFKPTLNATSQKPGDKYAYHGSVDIKIVDRDWDDEKSR